MDRIFIDGLRCECIVGVLPDERVKAQPLLIDAELMLSLEHSGRSGELEYSIDYAKLATAIMSFAQRRQARLLEELAVELCDMILQDFRPEAVRLKLRKPQALNGLGCPGIEVHRQLSDTQQ
ncbi:MAG: dihydroneopterin aldolase [Succinivibrio sp.]|nr:dihydroneopterin aldolase [Succinivibrio sp.]